MMSGWWLVLQIGIAWCAGLANDRFDTVRSRLDGWVSSGQLLGGSLLVSRAGQRFLHHFGQTKLSATAEPNYPVNDDTLFRMFSMTKTLSAVAGLMLWEEGRFSLQEPLANYLPEFAQTQVIEVRDCSQADGDTLSVTLPASQGGGTLCYRLARLERPISLLDVFTFRAGSAFPGTAVENSPRRAIYTNLFARAGLAASPDILYSQDTVREYCNSSLAPQYVQECINNFGNVSRYDNAKWASSLARAPLLHQPGQEWVYGMEADLLGVLVEVWSQQSLEEFFQQQLFTPLAMANSFFFSHPADPRSAARRDQLMDVALQTTDGLAAVDADTGRAIFGGPQTWYAGGSGVTSSVLDWAAFADCLLQNAQGRPNAQGVRLLSSATLQYATQGFVAMTTGDRTDGDHWGLGWATSDGTAPSSWAARSFGWWGAACTIFRVVPGQDLYWVATTAVFGDVSETYRSVSQALVFSLVDGDARSPLAASLSASPSCSSPPFGVATFVVTLLSLLVLNALVLFLSLQSRSPAPRTHPSDQAGVPLYQSTRI